MIPLCNFSLAMATGNDAEDLHLRIIHEWQRRGGILLRVKEIQSFESDTILAFYNILESTPKKYLLHEFRTILQEAQTMSQEIKPTNFSWAMEDLPSNITLPAMELCVQNPKAPRS